VSGHEPIDFVTKGGQAVEIREMDESYVFAGDLTPNPHTGMPGCCTADRPIDPGAATPNPVFEEYHRQGSLRWRAPACVGRSLDC
jgi:hypothetical protein